MRAVVIYESMYGNTHLVADAIADGLRSGADTTVLPLREADAATLTDVDLIVVGGPTHVHGMSRTSTRKSAIETAEKPGATLELDHDAEGDGLREWFDAVAALPRLAGAFDTRMHGPAVFTGRASKGIAKRLQAHGSELLAEPESFLVTKENHLDDDELQHARRWGASLLAAASGAQ
jgi:flavodoxin